MEEIWKDIEGYPNYMVSNMGRVKSLDRYVNNTHRNGLRLQKGKLLKPFLDSSKHKQIRLYKKGDYCTFQVHRLVAQAFIPNPNNHPVVNHKDENPSNNCVENLEWCTVKYNTNYGTANSRRSEKMKLCNYKPMLGKFGKLHHRSKPIYQYDLDGTFIKEWDNAREVERELNLSRRVVGDCALGKQKTAYGYKWRFKEEKAA